MRIHSFQEIIVVKKDELYYVRDGQTVITEATDEPLLANATDLIAAYAHQTSAKSQFGYKSHHRHAGIQRLQAHAAHSTFQTPPARSMRLTGPKGPGRRMERAGSTS